MSTKKPIKKAAKKAPAKEFDNSNRGVLFINHDKKGSTHPDYKGSFTDADGNEFWLSAWKKTSKDGAHKFLSISATLKRTTKTIFNVGRKNAFYYKTWKNSKSNRLALDMLEQVLGLNINNIKHHKKIT